MVGGYAGSSLGTKSTGTAKRSSATTSGPQWLASKWRAQSCGPESYRSGPKSEPSSTSNATSNAGSIADAEQSPTTTRPHEWYATSSDAKYARSASTTKPSA